MFIRVPMASLASLPGSAIVTISGPFGGHCHQPMSNTPVKVTTNPARLLPATCPPHDGPTGKTSGVAASHRLDRQVAFGRNYGVHPEPLCIRIDAVDIPRIPGPSGAGLREFFQIPFSRK